MEKALVHLAAPAILLGLLAPAVSARHTSAAGSIIVIARGFNNPRGPAISSDGTKTIAADNGLVGPADQAIGHRVRIFVSNHGVFPGAGAAVQVQP
jgi:hypothetical protein